VGPPALPIVSYAVFAWDVVGFSYAVYAWDIVG